MTTPQEVIITAILSHLAEYSRNQSPTSEQKIVALALVQRLHDLISRT